jgi:hypothetical protein
MASAFRVSRSISRGLSLVALPLLAAIALAACGGKVVVDRGGSGEGGAGGSGGTMSSATVAPSTGSVTLSTCDAAFVHLKECFPETVIPEIPACEGQVLCQLACILGTSCAGLDGTDPQASMKFASCANTCG